MIHWHSANASKIVKMGSFTAQNNTKSPINNCRRLQLHTYTFSIEAIEKNVNGGGCQNRSLDLPLLAEKLSSQSEFNV